MWMEVKAKTLSVLQALSHPKPTSGGTSEAVAWAYYDTAEFVSAATTQMNFFLTGRTNRQATNLDTPGAISNPKYFEIGHFGQSILREPSGNAWTDVFRYLMGGTDGPPTWTFRLQDKNYGPFPLAFLFAGGGIQGFGTATDQNYAHAAEPGGCGPNSAFQGGAIIIPPEANFALEFNWDTAQTLLDGDLLVQPFMSGVLHRAVK